MHLLRLSNFHHQRHLPESPATAATLAASSSTVNASLKVFIVHRIAAIVKTARTTSYLRISAKMPFSRLWRKLLMHSDQKSTQQLIRKLVSVKTWRWRRVPPTRRTKFRPTQTTLRVRVLKNNMRGAAPAKSRPVSRSIANASRLAYYAPVYANAIIAKTMRIRSNVKL